MDHGLETYTASGDISFDSEGFLTVLATVRVLGNTSFKVEKPPPYRFLKIIDDNGRVNNASAISVSNVGDVISVTYRVTNKPFIGVSVNSPATIVVLK